MNKYSLIDRGAIRDAAARIHRTRSLAEEVELSNLINDYADRGYALSEVVKLAESWAQGKGVAKHDAD